MMSENNLFCFLNCTGIHPTLWEDAKMRRAEVLAAEF